MHLFYAMITAQKVTATIEIVHSSLTGLDRIPYRVGVIGKKKLKMQTMYLKIKAQKFK